MQRLKQAYRNEVRNMAKKYTKDETIALKKKCFKNLNSLLESMIAKPKPVEETDTDYIKKAALISKWIDQYTNYISFEDKFTPKKLIRYKRGDIVFVNFGFNIGAEFGGEHYAVVIDKESDRNSSTITVVPLSSYVTGKKIHPNDLYLGNELFNKLQLKQKTIVSQLRQQCDKNKVLLELIKTNYSSNPDDEKIETLLDELEKKQKQLEFEIGNAEKIKSELLSLKQGSIAKIQQITTISKMRIYNPKQSSDPLYGIRFSNETMTLINNKIKDFFIFDE